MYKILHRKMTTFRKGTTVDTSNLQPGELVHVYFGFYNKIYIRGFTNMLTVVCEKTIMLWAFPTASKISPVRIIHSVLTILKNKQHPCKHVRVDQDGVMKKSTDVTNLLIDESKYT